MLEWRTILPSIAVAAWLLGESAVAQPRTIDVDHKAACPKCSLDTIRVLTLGGASSRELLNAYSPLARTTRGDYLALGHKRGSLVLFSSDGAFKQAVGSIGDGPGEFSRGAIAVFTDRNDSVYVLDAGRRVSVLTPTLRFVRMFRISGSHAASTLIPDGRLVYSALVASPSGIGYPLHMFSPAGEPILSFGAFNPTVLPGTKVATPREHVPVLVGADGRTVYSWSARAYSIDQWGLDGSHTAVLRVRDVPWLRELPSERMMMQDPRAASVFVQPWVSSPQPNISLVAVDKQGLVWINGHVPYRDSLSAGHVRGWGVRQLLEIIEPARGVMLASFPFPYMLKGIPGTDDFYSNTEDADGYPVIIVWRIRLVRN